MFLETAERIGTPLQANCMQTIAEALAASGWCVIPDFIEGADIEQLRRHAHSHLEADGFIPAGIGNGSRHEMDRERRSDLIRWIDPQDAEYGQLCGERFETLRLAVNARLYLGLFDLETHFAIYPPGAFYEKHLDQFRHGGRRKLTIILYLNREWRSDDGGQLLLYTNGNDDSEPVAVLPRAGTLVCFLSELFPHEVLPSRRERLSLTGWYRTRQIL
ncbi:MAG: 2OG-Fe(II) oxygenase [Gammaproteobacteria bacterium]